MKDSPSEYLENTWYMAAWSAEVDDNLLSRNLLGRRLLLTRNEEGNARILRDRCPHRFAPLSLGKRSGNTVTCGYHGLSFDLDGHCVSNPYNERTPGRAFVQSFPVCERHDIVWFWPGQPDLADESMIPDFSFIPDTPHSRTVCGSTPMNAGYEYGTDNLMDLSHVEFVHKASFGDFSLVSSGEHKVSSDGDTLHSNWWVPNINTPPALLDVYSPDTKVDHWLEMRWNAPSIMKLTVGATPAGSARTDGVQVEQAHILTPESNVSTHYFWSSTRFTDLESAEADEMLRQLFAQAFDQEDKPIIEAAFANMETDDYWEEKPIHLGVDGGGIMARKKLQQLIAAERKGSGK